MAHMNDERGCSKCKPGEERFERFLSGIRPRGMRVQYDYRTPSGRLFSTIAPTLEEARARRDSWLTETRYLDEKEECDDTRHPCDSRRAATDSDRQESD